MGSNVFPVSHYETKEMVLTGGTDTFFTVPANFWFDLTSIRVSNGTAGGSGTAKIAYRRSGGAVDFVLNDALAVAPGLPGDEECNPLHLEVGDAVKITSTANFHVFASIAIGKAAPAPAQGKPGAAGFKFGPGFGAT